MRNQYIVRIEWKTGCRGLMSRHVKFPLALYSTKRAPETDIANQYLFYGNELACGCMLACTYAEESAKQQFVYTCTCNRLLSLSYNRWGITDTSSSLIPLIRGSPHRWPNVLHCLNAWWYASLDFDAKL